MIPGFVDCHTHLVFAGDRGDEFAARMAGAPYAAGGIRVTTEATRAARDRRARARSPPRAGDEALRAGITHLEIKSGYGLDVDDERALVRGRRASCTDDVTFLGAHVVPAEYEGRADDYVALVCGEMLDACAPHARWIDVFCEEGAFDADQSRAVLEAGRAAGLGLRVHGNQLGPGPGVQLAVELGAASADHCTYLDRRRRRRARRRRHRRAPSSRPPTSRPASPTPTRAALIDAGVTVALATNCNPGSSYTTSMAFCIALAVRDMRHDDRGGAAGRDPRRRAGAAAQRRRPPRARRARRRRVLDAPSHSHLVYRPGRAAGRGDPGGGRRRVSAPRWVLGAVLGVWLVLAILVTVETPAFEASDEPDHIRNVTTLAGGHWYRIGPAQGLESHQPPAYYALLAGYLRLQGLPTQAPAVPSPLQSDKALSERGLYDHRAAGQALEEGRTFRLRLPGIVLGALTILLTAAAASRVSAHPWTPVVAAALVAGTPRFTFVSGVVNNDNLANALGALGILLGVYALTTRRRRLMIAAALGVVLGALVLTKVSTAPLGAALLFAALGATPRAQRLRAAGVFVAAAAIVCGWWLIDNQVRYGDPLASEETRTTLKLLAPILFATDPPLHQAFISVPASLWRSWWYQSGYNQFFWDWWLYLPFWLGLAAGLAALVVPRRRPLVAPRGVLIFLGLAVAGVLVTLWVVGMGTTTMQGRLGFYGLGAVAILFALGVERARAPVWARFTLPVLGFLAAALAIRDDVLGVFN